MTPPRDQKLWNPEVETLSADALAALQLRRLQAQVRYNYERSEFYRDKFVEVGLEPGDIRSFEDFRKLPLMDKNQHRDGQRLSVEKYGDPISYMNCARLDEVVRINSTSGTSGAPTFYALTAHDVAVVNEMHARKYWRAGIRPGDMMLQALSLSMFTGGLPLSQGIQNLGAAVIPVGIEGGTRRVLEHIEMLRPQALVATPSFGLYLLEQAPKLAGKSGEALGIRYFFCAGEPGGGIPSVRTALAEGFGARVFDHTGGGHAFHGISRDEPASQYSGMYFVSPDHCLLELIDPVTKTPIEMTDGARGEMVFSFLDWQGGPFMRYALGDIIEIGTSPCPDGWPGTRFKIVGRSDDMLIVKGVNVYPQAIQNVIMAQVPHVTGHFRIRLSEKGPLVQPPLQLVVERGEGLGDTDLAGLEGRLQERFTRDLRIRPQITWVGAGTFPREAKKARLIEIVNDLSG